MRLVAEANGRRSELLVSGGGERLQVGYRLRSAFVVNDRHV